MTSKDLKEKAEKIAWELSKKPSIYIKLIRIINWLGLLAGWVCMPFKYIKEKLSK